MQNLESKVGGGPEIMALRGENDRLRKEYLIVETELKRLKIQREKEENNSPSARSKAISEYTLSKDKALNLLKIKEEEANNLSNLLKKICPFTETYDYLALKEKESQYLELLSGLAASDPVSKQKRHENELSLVSIQKKQKYYEEEIVRKSEEGSGRGSSHLQKEMESLHSVIERKILPCEKGMAREGLGHLEPSELVATFAGLVAKSEK